MKSALLTVPTPPAESPVSSTSVAAARFISDDEELIPKEKKRIGKEGGRKGREGKGERGKGEGGSHTLDDGLHDGVNDVLAIEGPPVH